MVTKQIDGGFGLIRNLTIKAVLDSVSEEKGKLIREQLKKENPKSYKEFLEYEKIYDKA